MGLITQLIGNVGKAKMEEQRSKTAQIQDQVEAWRTIAASSETPDATKQKAIANILQLTSKHGGKEGKEHAPVLGMVLNKLAGVGMNIAGVPQQQQLPQAQYQLSPSELVMTPEQRAAKRQELADAEFAKHKQTAGYDTARDIAGYKAKKDIDVQLEEADMQRKLDTFDKKTTPALKKAGWSDKDIAALRVQVETGVKFGGAGVHPVAGTVAGTDPELATAAAEKEDSGFDTKKNYHVLRDDAGKIVHYYQAGVTEKTPTQLAGQLYWTTKALNPGMDDEQVKAIAAAKTEAVLGRRMSRMEQQMGIDEFMTGVGGGPGLGGVKTPPAAVTPRTAPPVQPGAAPAQKPATRFNTPIPAEQMKDYQDWVSQLPENLRGTDDYDLRGAFLEGVKPEAGHLTDQFKKPNHMTFSTESQYSGRNGDVGGRWVKSPDDKWTFYASPTNLKYHSAEQLQQYFQRAEPGNTLVLPPAAAKPAAPPQAQVTPRTTPPVRPTAQKPGEGGKLPPLTGDQLKFVDMYIDSLTKLGPQSGRGLQVGALRGKEILRQRSGVDPVTFNDAENRYKNNVVAISTSVQRAAALQGLSNMVDLFGERMVENGRKVRNSDSQWLNKPLNAITLGATGDEDLRKYLVDVNELKREYGMITAGGGQSKAMLPVGVSTDMDHLIDGNMPLKDAIATVEEVKLSSKLAQDGYKKQQYQLARENAENPIGQAVGAPIPKPPAGDTAALPKPATPGETATAAVMKAYRDHYGGDFKKAAEAMKTAGYADR